MTVDRQTLTILADAVEAYLLLLAHARDIGLEIDSGFGMGVRSGTHRPDGNALVRRAVATLRAAMGQTPPDPDALTALDDGYQAAGEPQGPGKAPHETMHGCRHPWVQAALPLFSPEWAPALRQEPYAGEGRR